MPLYPNPDDPEPKNIFTTETRSAQRTKRRREIARLKENIIHISLSSHLRAGTL
jgi:hypothetical protein